MIEKKMTVSHLNKIKTKIIISVLSVTAMSCWWFAENSILLNNKSSKICNNKNTEQQSDDIQNVKWKINNSNSNYISNDLIFKKLNKKQNKKWSSLSTSLTSVLSLEAEWEFIFNLMNQY